MTGRIVRTPDEVHSCETPSDDGWITRNRQAPWSWPAGTVWQCDTCRRTWLVRADQLPPGYANRKGWVREGRIARWWRERHQTWDVPVESTDGPARPLQPGVPTVCLLDHRHTADCPGAIPLPGCTVVHHHAPTCARQIWWVPRDRQDAQ